MAYLIALVLVAIGAGCVVYWSLCALWYVWVFVRSHRERLQAHRRWP